MAGSSVDRLTECLARNELRQRMIGEGCFGKAEWAREGPGAKIAGGADFERNGSLGEQGHQAWIASRGDAVADAFDAE